MAMDPTNIRAQFPALQSGAVFFDNPGGTQVPMRVIARMSDYLSSNNANRGGAFRTSQETDKMIAAARSAVADFLGAGSAQEIVFGPNMTSLTFNLARCIAEILEPDDEIIVTRLDHDANIAPWVQAAEASRARVRWLDFDVETGQLKLDHLSRLINPKTRLVAFGYASNALGTVNPVEEIVQMAKQVGAATYVDAVQYAPHGPIDVRQLGCDFLVVSAYKFYGPHVGALYGKSEWLDRLPAFKVRPASDRPPSKFETGTQNHEGIAGALGAIEYLADFAGPAPEGPPQVPDRPDAGRKQALHRAMLAVQAYESTLTERLVDRLQSIPAVRLVGTPNRRVPTVSCRMGDIAPRRIAEYLGRRGIYVWDGNFYAISVTERLGLEESGGLLRIGLAHYNTSEEIERLEGALSSAVGELG